VCCPGPKSLGWISKGVDSRWLWWRTTIRFVFLPQTLTNTLHPNSHKHTHTHKEANTICLFSDLSVESRSTRLCSSWTTPRTVNTCGRVPWRATPSSGYANRPRARPATATSHDSALASDSGRAQRWTRHSPFHSPNLLTLLGLRGARADPSRRQGRPWTGRQFISGHI